VISKKVKGGEANNANLLCGRNACFLIGIKQVSGRSSECKEPCGKGRFHAIHTLTKKAFMARLEKVPAELRTLIQARIKKTSFHFKK
jgi:hypothetical protein